MITKEQLKDLRQHVGKVGKWSGDLQIIIPGRGCNCAPNVADQLCEECVRYAVEYIAELKV